MEIRRTVYKFTSSSITSLHGGKYKPFYTIKHQSRTKKSTPNFPVACFHIDYMLITTYLFLYIFS